MCAFKQIKKKLLYGYATVQEKENGDIQVILRVKDQEQSTKDQTVWAKHKFVYDSKTFFSFLPKTVKELGDANKKYLCSMSEDGEKIFQFRPYNEDSMVVRLRGFYRKDNGDIAFNEGFKDKEHLTAIFETEVTQGPWTGAVYPFRYWNVTDKKTFDPVFKIVDGDITFQWITKPMRAILECSGVMERNPKCNLADTDDPQVILDWLEGEILKDKSIRLAINIKEGYPNWDQFELLGGDEDVEADDDDEEVEVVKPGKKVAAPVAKKFDENDED